MLLESIVLGRDSTIFKIFERIEKAKDFLLVYVTVTSGLYAPKFSLFSSSNCIARCNLHPNFCHKIAENPRGSPRTRISQTRYRTGEDLNYGNFRDVRGRGQ